MLPSCTVTGPDNHSGETKTTIDYIMLDIGAASLMKSCGTLLDNDLNTSDHLPQSVCLEFSYKVTSDVNERGKISFQVKSLAPHEIPTSIINFTITAEILARSLANFYCQ